MRLWYELAFNPAGEPWYTETGQGMGQTLQVANQQGAYTISDRGTYLALRDDIDLEIIYESDPVLLNVYHVVQVNPDKFDNINSKGAAAVIDYLLSDQAQQLIATFGVEQYGEPLFIPDAGDSEDDLRGKDVLPPLPGYALDTDAAISSSPSRRGRGESLFTQARGRSPLPVVR
jgi:tungstate transport system substrate-binding protein